MEYLTSDRPVWALVAPLDPMALRERAERALRERFRPADAYEPPWLLVQGMGGATAVVSYELGSEGTDAGIAEALSAGLPAPVYLLRFAEGNEVVWGYERGQLVHEHADNPVEVAAKIGLEIPGAAPAPAPAHVENPSLCFVPDRAPAPVARILGFDEPPAGGPLHVEAAGGGTVVYSEAGSAGIFLDELSLGTGGRVYLLAAHDGGRAFSCLVVDDGEDVGLYEYPERTADYTAPLDDVAGETEPARILQALGLPPSLLGLPSPG